MTNYLQTKKILDYNDIIKYPAGTSTEKLVSVAQYNTSITMQYMKADMLDITGNTIFVRDIIAHKLANIQTLLDNTKLHLKVVYGYRHPDIQIKYFLDRKQALAQQNPRLSSKELDYLTHNFVAIPDIAGHPAGAAVDVTIANLQDKDIDMGTKIADYSNSDTIKTYALQLTPEQKKNRTLLHNLMVDEGFAPFYGEWWHFSYGDREWAAFYNKKALYGAIDFRIM